MEPRFGLGLLPSDFQNPHRIIPRMNNSHHHLPTGYRRPWSIARQAKEMMTDQKNLHFTKDGFQASVDVSCTFVKEKF